VAVVTIPDLLERLNAADIRLRTRDGELVVSGRRERVDASLLEAIRVHKPALLEMIGDVADGWWAPRELRPDRFSLVDLSQEDLDRIIAGVAGGAANVQDIYPLAPLQEGVFFHHLIQAEGDPYLLGGVLRFESRERLDAYLTALRAVIARHDILRTAIAWEGLREPVQVVWREAQLRVEEVSFDSAGDDVAQQLYARFHPRRYRIDLREAPLMRVYIAREPGASSWFLLLLRHHLISDHTTQGLLWREIRAHLAGRADALPRPAPFRDYVAQARLGVGEQDHAAFFREMLADVTEPTAPFGLLNVWGDGSGVEEAQLEIEGELTARIRAQARGLGVSAASLCHVAWAQVLALASGQEDVVFGTVMAGRLAGGQGSAYGLGMFINTLPVRVRVGDLGAEDSVRRMHALLADLLQHEHASLALAQRCSGVAAPTPLFTSLFNHRHLASVKGSTRMPETWVGISKVASEERTNYPLTVSFDEAADGFRIDAQVQTSIGAARVCAMMLTALRSLVEALETHPRRALRNLIVLPADERTRVVETWNPTDRDYSSDACLHHLFEAQARRRPDAVAVTCDDGGQLTYQELNRRANQLAHFLRRRGVGPDVCVGLYVERSLELVVAVLSVLKAGGAYVPLDPSYPAERLRDVLHDSQVRVLITESGLRQRLDAGAPPGDGLEVLSLDTLHDALVGENRENPSTHTPADALAYVIYTSGSTGRPKGVLVTHANVTRLFPATAAWFDFGENDVWTLFHSIAFDFSVWELWGPLLHGGRLVIVPFLTSRAPDAYDALLRREGVTVLNQTPSAFRQLMHAGTARQSALRLVIFGGEALEPDSLRPWYDRHGDDHPRLVNMYGITETTVHVTYQPLRADDVTRASVIGRPIPDLQVYLLDARGEPVPIGAIGELHVGGAGLARGYLRRPGLTADRFVADAFSGRPGARLYRSGDIGRWRPDGTIEFLGRNDHQVKVRGHRIELGEIEARLRDHPAVRDAVVIARDDHHGGQQLVAYYVAVETVDADQMRMHLSRQLPEPMVPAAYVPLDAIPITAHGKLDRGALPQPAGDAFASPSFEPPSGEVENAVARIWAELLGRERVGRHDNFFASGGHSLLAVRLVERLRQARLHTDVRTLFAAPTLAALAAAVRHEAREIAVPPSRIPHGCDAITPDMLPLVSLSQDEIDRIVAGVGGGSSNVEDIYPLAPLQEGILFHHLVDGAADPYVVTALLAFDDRVLVDRYVAAVQAVVVRHALLRTGVVWEGLREPVQVVWRDARVPVEEVELGPNDGDVADQLRRYVDPPHYRFDVRQAPLIRLFIARDAAQHRWIVMRLQHHLISDHMAGEVIQAEIQAHLLGRADGLPPALPFRDYVARARLSASADEHTAFFKKLLEDVDEPTAPFGLLDVRGDDVRLDSARLEVEPHLSSRVRERARALGVSVASVCHVAFALMLARVSRRDDVVFGTVLFGRTQGGIDVDRVLGLFINTLPVRIRLGQTAEAGVRGAHAMLADLLRHEHAPLALAQRCSRVAPSMPLFSALFNYRHSGVQRARLRQAAVTGMKVVSAHERTNYPLTLSMDDWDDGLRITTQVRGFVDAARVCALMHAALVALIEALETAPARALGSLDVLPADERVNVLTAWNATDATYPEDSCLHELFEAQVARSPDAVAVICGELALTYEALNARSNQLAHVLAGRGVGPDVRVGICLERSLDMVVGLLGILKAGGAYVPLDPSYPPVRLAHVLGDSAPVAVLTQRSLRGMFEATGLPLIAIDSDLPPSDGRHSERAASSADLRPNHLAYVIYTSGSTGRPKGIAIEHRNAVNFVAWCCRTFAGRGLDRTLFSTSLNFDLAVFECFVPLATGATIQLVRDALSLADTSVEPTLINTVPSVMQTLVELGHVPASARTVNLAGEPLTGTLATRMFSSTAVQSLCNLYGPSETTTYSTYVAMTRDEGFVPHIGRPIANTRIYILDDAGEPVPVGTAGELCIGGAGVARGYLGQPALTAERFVPDAFGTRPGLRMYRTGDLARWRSDGTIEFIGRSDHQVKVRGFRIELGEIEFWLREHPSVRQALVVAGADHAGNTRLVAYWVGEALDVDSFRAHLRERLPEYMVPSAFVRLETMPLTPNGKVDRNALPAPEATALQSLSYQAPVGDREAAIAEIWRDVLGVSEVGRHDHFFGLGGHSLTALRVLDRLRQAGIHVHLNDLFAYPTVESLAARSARPETRDDAAIPLRATGVEAPLFLVHDGLGAIDYAQLLTQQLEGDYPVYALPPPSIDESPLQTIEEMGKRLVRLIRSAHPSGPYRIAGWSFGGVLAYETAVQLLSHDEAVEFVGLVDPTPLTRSGASREDADDVGALFRMLRASARGEPERLARLAVLAAAPTRTDVESLMARCCELALVPEHTWTERHHQPSRSVRLRAAFEHFRARERAVRHYVPPLIPVPISFFRASEQGRRDSLMAWRDRVPRAPLRVIQVPGDHASMLRSPQLEALGRALSEALRGTRGDSAPMADVHERPSVGTVYA
jgi:amino acid adenylation domain-containing protein